jgi:hypothetical protein
MEGEEHVRLHIDDDDDSKSSSRDIDRMEEGWGERNQSFFKEIQAEIKHKANLHDVASHSNKKKYIWTAVPVTVLPLILANVSMFTDVKYVDTIGLTVVSVINGMQTLFNFSKKVAGHNEYAGKYMELSSEIDKVLVRSKRFREPFDVVLERITAKKNQLDNNAPYL